MVKRSEPEVHLVRARYQFGRDLTYTDGFQLFLDDARNPPRDERGWAVVRTVQDGINLLLRHGNLVTTVSLDNDLNADPQGIELLKWILKTHQQTPFPRLKRFIIHTGNLPQGRAMWRLLRGQGFTVKRVEAFERIYPRAADDPRRVKPYITSVRRSTSGLEKRS